MSSLLPLPRDEVHLWYVVDEDVRADPLIAAYMALLSPEEETRRARYYFEKGRREYLLTRALVRSVLSRYRDVTPASWAFSANAHGRPEIASPAGCSLRFNLTNTAGLVACLVAEDREIGVDVEDVNRQSETIKIADRFFSPSEVAALHAEPEERQRARFFDYWTLKEAYIKARGMGLAIPLEDFSFAIEPAQPIRISFAERLPDRPETWQFAQLEPTREHLISVAIRRENEPDLRIVVRRTVPLLRSHDSIERIL